MKFVYATILAFATAALAAPGSPIEERKAVPTYDPSLPTPPTFTNVTCTLSKALTPGQPLMQAFPTADKLGKIIGKPLTKALGDKTVEDIDKVAENLCVSANQDPADGNGLCNNALQAVRDFADNTGPKAADKYRCLLNLLCVAHHTPKNKGTCQYLLAGVDCVANRVVDANAPECPNSSGT